MTQRTRLRQVTTLTTSLTSTHTYARVRRTQIMDDNHCPRTFFDTRVRRTLIFRFELKNRPKGYFEEFIWWWQEVSIPIKNREFLQRQQSR